MAEVHIKDGIGPDMDEAFVVIVASAADTALLSLGDLAYEGEGAFFVSTTDAWVERHSDDDSLDVVVRSHAAVLFRGRCSPATLPLAQTTLVISHDGPIEELWRALSDGDAWPLVLGPGA